MKAAVNSIVGLHSGTFCEHFSKEKFVCGPSENEMNSIDANFIGKTCSLYERMSREIAVTYW